MYTLYRVNMRIKLIKACKTQNRIRRTSVQKCSLVFWRFLALLGSRPPPAGWALGWGCWGSTRKAGSGVPWCFSALSLIPRLSRVASGCLASLHPPQLFTLYLPRDAEFMAAFGAPGTVESEQVWGHPLLSLNTKTQAVRCMTFSPVTKTP